MEFDMDVFVSQLSGQVVALIVNFIIGIAVLVVLPKLFDYLKVGADDKRRALLEAVITNGIKWAAARVSPNYRDLAQLADPAMPNDPEVIAQAKTYVKNAAPDTLKKLGVTEPQLQQAIEVRIPKAASELSATIKTVHA